MPVTIADEDPIVATPVLLLVHEPPGVAELSVVVAAIFTVAVPFIAAGAALTVTAFVVRQPLGRT